MGFSYGFAGRMWDSIVVGSGHCIFFYFDPWKNDVHSESSTEDPRYNDSVCYQSFCCKIEFAVVNKLDRNHLKHQQWIRLNTFLYKLYV